MNQDLDIKERWKLKIQCSISYFLFPTSAILLYIFLKIIMRYKFLNIEQIREQFKKIKQSHEAPFILCTNHLTLIDSLILIRFTASTFNQLKSYRLFPWSLPEAKNFYQNIWLKIFSYVGKCLPVHRGKGIDGNKILFQKISYLLNKDQLISIFPEGTRSRKGLIEPENTSYGIGKILDLNPKAKIICLYLRGKKQDSFSNFPKRGEEFIASIDLLSTTTVYTGLKARKDLSLQVINKLKEMEMDYFNSNRT